MKFIDQAKITILAGNGGNGIISFRREANVDRGGPDGGDGGKGGDVYFQGDNGMNTLLPFHYQTKYSAQNGENGKTKNAYGANGNDLIIKVPIGTMIINSQTNDLIADIIDENQYLVAKGGFGGKGNAKFKSSWNTAPRICENGTKGESFEVILNLKVLADVGFIGKPSAGKSSLLSKISNAKPKIADYDFTTLVPQLGLVSYKDKSYVVADLPGLIEFASQGKGLGIQFLKHIERCKVIAHIIDFGSEEKDPIYDYLMINNELKQFNLFLEKLPQIVIANKNDLGNFSDNFEKFTKRFPNVNIVKSSSLTGNNIDKVKEEIYKLVSSSNKVVQSFNDKEKEEITISLDLDKILINKISNNKFEIISEKVYKIYNKIPLVSIDNLWRLNAKLKSIGVYDLLKSNNIKNGDIVKILDYEFVWDDQF